MATLHADTNGVVLRWLATKDLESAYPTAPSGTTSSLTFPRSNNQALWNDLNKSTDAYRLNGAVLTKSGVTQTVNLTDPNSRDGLVQRLDDNRTAVSATTTLNQLKSEVNNFNQIVRDLVRNMSAFPNE